MPRKCIRGKPTLVRILRQVCFQKSFHLFTFRRQTLAGNNGGSSVIPRASAIAASPPPSPAENLRQPQSCPDTRTPERLNV